MSFDLSRLDVDVNDTVKLAMTANLKQMGEKGFEVDVQLKPLSLPKLLSMAPPGARAVCHRDSNSMARFDWIRT